MQLAWECLQFHGTLLVPRISENEHKDVIEQSPADSRVVVPPDKKEHPR